jgi:glutamate formiminotransferase/glutamate formiminotransferase/formiminotetrahydrofolate cyclodeaminase
VPNFSEGRTAEVVHALLNSITATSGVFLLDQEMDWDHHRCVITFAGSPDAAAEAAVAAARTAQDRIDLRHHQGGHPRVGATDVIPFIPLRGVTMEDCIGLARHVGERIAAELGIPVFLYERAATRSERTNLEDIRKGGAEGLAHRMATDPAWRPDFGPSQLHPSAGATIVGARPPLIAYNVNLDSRDLSIAKAIAKTIRASSGGLPAVKAIGVELKSRGFVQVSMNLTDVERTPIDGAFEAVKQEAERHAVYVKGSEIVGLVPQHALLQVAEHYLRLEGFLSDQVLEIRLEKALAELPAPGADGWQFGLAPFMSALSAGTPTPGGGSVAALAGALAASLGLMACRVTAGRTQRADAESQQKRDLTDIQAHLQKLQQRLMELIRIDAEAFEGVLQAYRMPKDDPARAHTIAQALIRAAEVPLETAALADETAERLLQAREITKPAVTADLTVGVFMARAAIEGGIENVEVNLKAIENQPVRTEMLARVEYLRKRLVELRGVC